MKRFIILLSLLFLCSCASPRSWTKKEKIAAGFFLLAHSADAITTSQLTENGNHEKYNKFILSEHPSDTKVAIYFSLTAMGALTLSHFYPNLREPLLYGYGGINMGLAIHNYNLNK